ncbi:MAG TPA: RsmD family RNA methyltransferase [Microbacteriaceae bacterium]|nr:RsmD family RNA methyltransferase [Microbacteriaceae bacterium]
MTRIIGGYAGSLSLVVPKNGTRPTSDRVREAVFSALDARGMLPGAHVLDLYAGSGALGLEAASRGAARVTLVESAAAAVRACRRNAAAVVAAAAGRVDVPTIDIRATTVMRFLEREAHTGAGWNVVFLDPPYALAAGEMASALRRVIPGLAPGASIVAERGVHRDAFTPPAGLEEVRQSRYGDTVVSWLSRAPAREASR